MIRWRRERLFTPVFWPGEFHGLYSLWRGKKSDTAEQLSLSFSQAMQPKLKKKKKSGAANHALMLVIFPQAYFFNNYKKLFELFSFYLLFFVDCLS